MYTHTHTHTHIYIYIYIYTLYISIYIYISIIINMLKEKRLTPLFHTVLDIPYIKYMSFVKGCKSKNVYNCVVILQDMQIFDAVLL